VADDAAALSPAVRRAVLEHGIDPATVKGTGKDGRLTKEDVLAAAVAKQAAPAPVVAAPAPAPAAVAAPVGGRREERVKMTRLRQTIAKRLKSAQETAAMLTTFNDVDMSAVMEARAKYKDVFEKKHGVKLGLMSFFAKASVLALKDIPSVNAQLQGDEIVYIERAYSERSGMQVVRAIGGRAPLHLTSVGKLFLAAEDPVKMRAYAQRTKLFGNTTNSITHLDALELELSKVKQSGVARDNEELELGVRCMACGIYDDEHQLVAGLSISAPADRLDAQWLAHLQSTALEISKALGDAQ
jgi:hypothetical protein